MRTLTLILFILSIVASPSAFGQKGKMDKADKAYNAGEYYNAIDLYKDAYSSVKDKNIRDDISYKIGLCYRYTNDPSQSRIWFNRVVKNKYPDPKSVLYLADAQKMLSRYDDAIKEYKKYSLLVPNDARGENGVTSCELAKEWIENPTNFEVANMRAFNNTKAMDYSPAFARDDNMLILFTSTREGSLGKMTHGATGQNFSDIYMSKLDKKGKWSAPTQLDENINSEFEDGTPSLSADYNTMYFSRCKYVKSENLSCKILESKQTEDGWGEPKVINIEGDSSLMSHPAISPDGTILYFVSDRKGGFGGKDIWKLSRATTKDTWGEPECLDKSINTEGDEMFPFVYSNGDLYFSSNGLIGMGGLDIYKASLDENNEWVVENMKSPINSASDDFGITIQSNSTDGFFSSSRKGSDDIYSFSLPPLLFSITGTILDGKTEEPVTESTVKLISSSGLTLEIQTDSKGIFKYNLKPQTDYIFLASKEGYLRNKSKETTKGLIQDKEFLTTIYLSPTDKPIDVENILYAFASWELRPESLVTLDKLVETLNDNANVTIELMSHTDARGGDEANLELSQKRAQSVTDYLIYNGIIRDRLVAKGYGESTPRTVDAKLARENDFLKEGDILTEAFINSLDSEEKQEIAHQLNRRTEFKVLRTDYQ